MHDAQKFSEKLGDFTSPDNERFQKQLRRIVDAVDETLKEFSKHTPAAPEDPEDQDHGVKIFVADVADSLQDFRDRIIAETAGKKVQVISNIPPPMDSAQHAASVEQALVQADLSIHLFDKWPGRKIINQKTTTYPRRQWEIALKSEVRKLVWLKGRIKKAFNIVSEHLFETDDAFALKNIWVFLAPASGRRVELPQFPPLIKINVLDNSHAETIDPQVISPLLQHAHAGGPA